jgi:hypothetical protein
MSHDPAFLWETEAMRSSPRRATKRRDEPEPPAPPGRWVTLREAESETGIPRATVRNWARKGRIGTRTGDAPGAPRLVDLDDVIDHATERGRTPAPPPPPPTPPASASTTAEVPAGSMIVPVDAWERILMQLGNLHEAGRELAEARERAARAETEAAFLRERLAEMRERTDPPPDEPAPAAPRAETWLDRFRAFRRR